MARAKRTLLTLDVEEFCDASSILVSAEEYRAFLLGFQAGIRGTQGREDAGAPFLASYTIGIGMLLKKVQTARKCAKAGEKGHAALMNLRQRGASGPDELAPMGSADGCADGRRRWVAPMGADELAPMGGADGRTNPAPMGSADGRNSPIGTEPPLEKMPYQETESSAFEPEPEMVLPGMEKPPRRKEEAAAPAPGGPQVKPRKPRPACKDITPENAEFLQEVYKLVPKAHPITGEPVHKGSYAQAARAFQGIINTGEATARELRAVGKLYYALERLPAWRDRVIEAWDYRDRAMMHVSTLYGPEKGVYQQLLPVARDLIAEVDRKASAILPQEGVKSEPAKAMEVFPHLKCENPEPEAPEAPSVESRVPKGVTSTDTLISDEPEPEALEPAEDCTESEPMNWWEEVGEGA